MRRRLGFTLIELVISLGIIVLLLALAIPLFRGSGERNKLMLTAQEVKNTILEAKNLALSPRMEKAANVDKYSIKFNQPANNQYAIYEGTTPISAKTLPDSISFSSLPNQFQIDFSIKNQGLMSFHKNPDYNPTTDPAPEELNLILHSSTTNTNRTITINRLTGQISID